MPQANYILLSFILLVGAALADQTVVDTTLLKELLDRRNQHSHIHAVVTQQKALPSISETLVTKGQVWIVPEQSFRWELGTPPTDMAILQDERVYVYDLKNQTHDKHKADSRSMRPMMLLLGMGKYGSYEGLLKSFRATRMERQSKQCIITLVPDSSIMKRALSKLMITFDVQGSFPTEVAWTQKDGTEITTKFSNLSYKPFNEEQVFTIPVEGVVRK